MRVNHFDHKCIQLLTELRVCVTSQTRGPLAVMVVCSFCGLCASLIYISKCNPSLALGVSTKVSSNRGTKVYTFVPSHTLKSRKAFLSTY